jgi:hypothetical protein
VLQDSPPIQHHHQHPHTYVVVGFAFIETPKKELSLINFRIEGSTPMQVLLIADIIIGTVYGTINGFWFATPVC